jgi:hypothetical protein
MIPSRSGSSSCIERSRLVLSLSFNTSSLPSFTDIKPQSARTLAFSLNVPISRLNSASICEHEGVSVSEVHSVIGREMADVEGCVCVARGGHEGRKFKLNVDCGRRCGGGERGGREYRIPGRGRLPSCTKWARVLGAEAWLHDRGSCTCAYFGLSLVVNDLTIASLPPQKREDERADPRQGGTRFGPYQGFQSHGNFPRLLLTPDLSSCSERPDSRHPGSRSRPASRGGHTAPQFHMTRKHS